MDCHFPSPGDLPNIGIEPTSPALAGGFINILIYTAHWAHLLSHAQLFAIPCALAHQAPLSMEFSRQQYWSGLPFPPPPGQYTLMEHYSALRDKEETLTFTRTWLDLEGIRLSEVSQTKEDGLLNVDQETLNL